MNELGWVVAVASLVANLYQMHQAWKTAQVLESIEELKELIGEYIDGLTHEPSHTR